VKLLRNNMLRTAGPVFSHGRRTDALRCTEMRRCHGVPESRILYAQMGEKTLFRRAAAVWVDGGMGLSQLSLRSRIMTDILTRIAPV